MKIVKLDIDENSILAGIDAVALVEQPAIEEDFMYFSKQEFADTFNDYPEAAVEAAKQGIKRNEELGNPCATQVGKVRAQQLANREPVSLDTVRRMRSFLIRQKDNYELARDRKDYDACGYISYLLWGGEAALPWTEKKLRQAGEEFEVDTTSLPDYSNEIEGLIVEEIIKSEFNIVDRIEGVPVYSMKEEAIAKAKELGCEGYHEHTLASGEIVFMPCSEHTEATDKVLSETFDDMGSEEQDAIINALDNVGISDEDMLGAGYIEVDKDSFYRQAFAQIITTPNKPSQADFGNLAVRYKYTGPKDDRNRKFCARLMSLNKIFRREDINNLSITGENVEFGIYDIFRYKGSYNCRHYWAEKFYKRDSSISTAKRALANSNRILDGTTTNSPVIQKSGKADSVPGLAKTSFAALDEKQMLVGPLMVPNKLIPRIDEDGNEYYVYFTADTIKKLSYKMMKDKLIDSVNIEHDNADRVDDAFLVETWLIEDDKTDKSRKYGFDLPNGTWMGMYKIDNTRIWEEYVKTGLVKGFSVEGYFSQFAMSKTQCRKNGGCACGKTENPNGLCDGSHLK
jgi:hypothetical protein